jgi:hypothetical protein
MITEQLLKDTADFEGAKARVLMALIANGNAPEDLLQFFNEYAKWNSYFAGGVAQLVANIASAEELFMEPNQPRALADRAQYIASFIFDAARDEFDDHINRQRDPHRSLAQAMLHGLATKDNLMHVLDAPTPGWLIDLCDVVVPSYGGMDRIFEIDAIFYGMGYHLGSELLADQEFSIIDKYMREEQTKTFEYLKLHSASLADATHRDYAWIAVHSGTDGGAEADHFAWALEGINKALELQTGIWNGAELKERCIVMLLEGFKSFEADHEEFFNTVGQDV